MNFSISNRALLRGMLAGAVVLTGTACSRSDRSESGRDNSAAVLPDTMSSSAQQDTSAQSNSPPVETAPAEKEAAGYRSMERDTTNIPGQHSDSARVTADTADGSVSSDTSVSQISPPADTADQLDTLAVSDTADGGRSGAVLAAGVAGAAVAAASRDGDARDNAGGVTSPEAQNETRGRVTESTSTAVSDTAGTLQARVDTSHHAEASDSGHAGAVLAAGAAGAAVAAASRGDDAEPGSTGDRADATESERVRPPEDSTELLGNVTSSETADEEPVTASEQETVSASRTDAVGAAAMGGTLTGAEAVGLMTRQGTQCTVVDPESDEGVRWDMSSTPITLNPCGMGSMNLSRIWTRVE